jgi:multisubunit Na+/H+ antiporter MnhF subunit
MAAGLSPAQAARAGVRDFGDPRVLAAQFSAALSRATARRVGLTLLGTGPLVGLVWVTAFAGRAGGARWDDVASPTMTPTMTLPALLPILGVTVLSALVALVAGSRRPPRVLSIGPRGAVTAALAATLGCVLADGLLLTSMLSTPGPGWSVAAAVACLASSVRLIAAGTAARRCVALRAAVP